MESIIIESIKNMSLLDCVILLILIIGVDWLKSYFTKKGSNNDEKRNRILDDLTNLVAKGENALTEKNKLKASKIWRQLLGDRFPLAEDVTESGVSVEHLKEYAEGIRNNNLYLSKSGTFGEKGILAQPHKFYGSKK